MTRKNLFEKYRHLYSFEEGEPQYLIDEEYFESALEEFAKYHVQEALKAAYENSEVRVTENTIACDDSCYTSYDDGIITVVCDEKSILNAYPLTNIK